MACAADTQGDDEDGNVSADNDLTSSFTLSPNATKTLNISASTTKDVSLTIDCSPPDNPDDPGAVFSVTTDLGSTGPMPSKVASYWNKTGSIPSGAHTITIKNGPQGARCSVKTLTVPTSQSCKSRVEWRSQNTDHTHYRVGEQGARAGWDTFPASGNHWGSWAKWNTVYPKAIQTGFLLHDLEHGGVVLSYKCSSNASAECKAAEAALIRVANGIGSRVIVTPDPSQPSMYAVRAWRTAYSSDCLDETAATKFGRDHIRHGREDIDADPPIPFDPTTLNVPCQDLMAAPDSCGQ